MVAVFQSLSSLIFVTLHLVVGKVMVVMVMVGAVVEGVVMLIISDTMGVGDGGDGCTLGI